MEITRLNWGCGPQPVAGWTNLDMAYAEGVDVHCDIRLGIPLPANMFDYAVGIHVLQDLAWGELPKALGELRRVLKPDGVLRLGLPDMVRAIEAYRQGNRHYFFIGDEDARSLGGKLVAQLIWYGSVRTPFTTDFAEELLENAGFSDIRHCAFKQTHSEHEAIVVLDNRERESFYVEARK